MYFGFLLVRDAIIFIIQMLTSKSKGPLPDPTTGADRTPQAEIDFIKAQAPKAKYVMSVCAGSAILAAAGVLSGKKATTNKMMLRTIEVDFYLVAIASDALTSLSRI